MTERIPIQVSVDYLFPIPLMRLNLKDQITKDVIDELGILEDYQINEDNCHRTLNSNMMTNNSRVLDRKKLGKIIQGHLDSYCTNVLGEDPKLRITTSWMNYNKPGTSHHKHPHPNSKVSGVFYIQTGPNCGLFNLHKPFAIDELIRDKKIRHNEFTYSTIWYEPEQYDLFMFPSFLEHSVTVNESSETRISLAFNSFYGYSMSISDDSYNIVPLSPEWWS